MTRGELIFKVSNKISLVSTAGDDEATLLGMWANEAVVDVLMKTHCRVEIGDMALTPGVDAYRTDDSVLAVLNERITSVSTNYQFEVVAMADILDMQRGVSANPFPFALAIEGTLLIVFPAPVTADTIRWIYVPRPTLMTLDAHDPSNATYGGIPTQYHRALEYYMLWQASEYSDKTAVKTAKDYRNDYIAEINDIKKGMRKQARRGLGPSRVGYPGSARFPRRNDQYPRF